MIIFYNTFHLVKCDEGILMVSVKSTDHPFIIINNDVFGLLVFHAGDENYDVRRQIVNADTLDMTKMITYHAEVEYTSHWAISIPYEGKVVKPHLLYAFTNLSIHKEFSENDFPKEFRSYKNLAVVTGFPE
jgi:hypothetical protein